VRVAELEQSDEAVHRLHEGVQSSVSLVGPGGVRRESLRLENGEQRLCADEKVFGAELEEIGALAHGGETGDQDDPTSGTDLLEVCALPPGTNVHAARFEEHDIRGDRFENPLSLVDAPREGRLPAVLPNRVREGLPRLGVLGHDHDTLRHPRTAPRYECRRGGRRVNPGARLEYHSVA